METDQTTSVAQLKAEIAQFVGERNWESYHNPKNLSMSIGIEAAELQEHFQWATFEEAVESLSDPQKRAEIADELADILVYCLSFANTAGLDISRSIREKMARNKYRFPPPGREST